MNNILNRWRSITIGFLILSYLAVIVFMHQPIAIWFILVGTWILLLVLIFFGTFIGIIGVLLQTITRKQKPFIPFFRAAYKFGTQNATILASYGLVLLRENNAEEALRCFDRALTNSTYFMSTKTLKCNKAIALWKLDQVEEAINLYLEVIENFGKDNQKFMTDRTYDQEGIDDLVAMNTYLYPQDYTTIGFLYTLQGQYEEATFFSKAALAKKDDFAAAYDNLGQIDYFQKRIPEAKAHFDKALELNPNLPDSLFFAGLVALFEGDKEKGKDYLLKARECKIDGLNTVSYEMVDAALKGIDL